MSEKLTGYPSIDKPWLKYYKKEAEKKALNTPKNLSVYHYYLENVFTDPDYPVLKYFNATFTVTQFLEMIDMWARAFAAVGVKPDEMVAVYGAWCPEFAAIFFALNALGAYPYYEKLAITESSLREETTGARIGVVFEPLWNDAAKSVFFEDRFEKVFMVGLSDSMRFPMKQLIKIKNNGFRKSVPNSNKYVFKEKVKELASKYHGSIEVPFKNDRIAVITASSGSTGSVVKGIMDTNESMLSNILSMDYSDPGWIAKKECFITCPPAASTAINCGFLLPLLRNMTVRIDPRADEDSWTKLLLKYKPSLAINTGSLWYSFSRRIDEMIKQGKSIDLSFADSFTMGGSGVTPEQLVYINSVLKKCNAPHQIVSGYGCSEFFGVMTVDKYDVEYIASKSVNEVGIPIPGAVVSVFNSDGKELTYNQRGEICAIGPSIMHGYFRKPELSLAMFNGDWLKTGDIGEIDDNGYIYIYGRIKDSVTANGQTVYLFDIANDLRSAFHLDDCMVKVKKLVDGKQSIVVCFVQKADHQIDEKEICIKMNSYINERGLVVDGYRKFDVALPISPTTLKPKSDYLDGFVNYLSDGKRVEVHYTATEEKDVFEIHTNQI